VKCIRCRGQWYETAAPGAAERNKTMTPEETGKSIAENIPYTHPEIVDEDALAAIIAAAIRDYGDSRAEDKHRAWQAAEAEIERLRAELTRAATGPTKPWYE